MGAFNRRARLEEKQQSRRKMEGRADGIGAEQQLHAVDDQLDCRGGFVGDSSPRSLRGPSSLLLKLACRFASSIPLLPMRSPLLFDRASRDSTAFDAQLISSAADRDLPFLLQLGSSASTLSYIDIVSVRVRISPDLEIDI